MKIAIILLILIVLVIVVLYTSRKKERIDRKTVASIDLGRYMGKWYEIARFDHRFERGLTHVTAEYNLLPDNRVEVLNSGTDPRTGRRKRAKGKAYPSATPGRLRVSFFWKFYADYNVLNLGANYDWVLIGSHSSKYLWILSRQPSLPAPQLDYIVRLARQRGYRTDRLLYVEQ